MKYNPLSAGPAAVKYGLDVRVCARMRVCVKERERERSHRTRRTMHAVPVCLVDLYLVQVQSTLLEAALAADTVLCRHASFFFYLGRLCRVSK